MFMTSPKSPVKFPLWSQIEFTALLAKDSYTGSPKNKNTKITPMRTDYISVTVFNTYPVIDSKHQIPKPNFQLQQYRMSQIHF